MNRAARLSFLEEEQMHCLKNMGLIVHRALYIAHSVK